MNPFRVRFLNMATNRGCKNNPDIFCYNCGEFTKIPNRKRNWWFSWQLISCLFWNENWWSRPILGSPYYSLQNLSWAFTPMGKLSSLKFGVPVVWLKPQNHQDDCYFCAFNSVGLNKKLKNPPILAIQACGSLWWHTNSSI